MAKPSTPEPVSVKEVRDCVLAAIESRFRDRHLDIETARMGLAQAAFDLIHLHLQEVTANPPKPRR